MHPMHWWLTSQCSQHYNGDQPTAGRCLFREGVLEVTTTEGLAEIEVHPVTRERWPDFEALFGEHGACGGCWCMWWRLRRSEFERQKGEGNRQAIKAIVESDEVPGVLAYVGGVPAGWCCVAPRDRFPTLDRSRVLQRVDDAPVWSIVCFFVDRRFRNRGLSVHLLKAAIEYVRQQGGQIVEGYPTEPRTKRVAPAFVYTGLASAFRKAGFVECARRSETRPIMRFYL
jgi:GNAT superfamily N-acetyltransferase